MGFSRSEAAGLRHHVAIRRVEGQGLAQDGDELVDKLLLLPLEQQEFDDLLVGQIDVLRGGVVLALIGHSGPSRFWARLLIDVSTMIDAANALLTSSQAFAVAFSVFM